MTVISEQNRSTFQNEQWKRKYEFLTKFVNFALVVTPRLKISGDVLSPRICLLMSTMKFDIRVPTIVLRLELVSKELNHLAAILHV